MPDPRPAEAITEFSTPEPTPNPAQPDFQNKGKIIDLAAPDTNPITSKSIKVNDRAGAYPQKNIYAISDQAGSFDVMVMLDESEAVWRKIATVAVTADTLAVYSTTNLFEQMRVVYTPSAAGNVKVWGFSLP